MKVLMIGLDFDPLPEAEQEGSSSHLERRRKLFKRKSKLEYHQESDNPARISSGKFIKDVC